MANKPKFFSTDKEDYIDVKYCTLIDVMYNLKLVSKETHWHRGCMTHSGCMTQCGDTRKMVITTYHVCEYASCLFRIMWQLDLIEQHPLVSLSVYVDFYERVKDRMYGV